jgi:hypothetical protein
MIIEIPCIKCGKQFKINCTEQQLIDFKKGKKKIQSIFPELPPDVRELFLTNQCGECFDKIFENKRLKNNPFY